MSCLHGNHEEACDICDDLTVAYMSGLHDGKKKRTWVDLTDEDIQDALPGYRSVDAIDIARVIEAKLKEKNNA